MPRSTSQEFRADWNGTQKGRRPVPTHLPLVRTLILAGVVMAVPTESAAQRHGWGGHAGAWHVEAGTAEVGTAEAGMGADGMAVEATATVSHTTATAMAATHITRAMHAIGATMATPAFTASLRGRSSYQPRSTCL